MQANLKRKIKFYAVTIFWVSAKLVSNFQICSQFKNRYVTKIKRESTLYLRNVYLKWNSPELNKENKIEKPEPITALIWSVAG